MMNSEDLLERWNSIDQSPGAYTRVDPNHPMEFYIGYESMGQRSLLLIGGRKPSQLPSSKSILVQIGQRHDRRWAVSFRLIRQEQEDVFAQLCCDLIESSRQQLNTNRGVEFVAARYKHWHELMEGNASGLLSEAARKGLIGELLFLQSALEHGMSPIDAVQGWMGPEKGDRDFVFANTWYEVKTVGTSAETVHIASLEQLDADPPGQLVVYFLDRTAPADRAGFSLNDKIRDLRILLQESPEALGLFDRKLTMDFGYASLPEYTLPVYRCTGHKEYAVDCSFPRLTRRNVPTQVASATYELSLSALEEWSIE